MNESMRAAGPQPAPTQSETAPSGSPAAPAGDSGEGRGPSPAADRAAPLGVLRTPTGNDQVDACLERLSDLDHLAADGHVEVYEDVHRGLRDTLTALDARPGPPAPSPSHAQSHEHRS